MRPEGRLCRRLAVRLISVGRLQTSKTKGEKMVAKFALALVALVFCLSSGSAQSRGRVTAREREDIFRLIRRDEEFVKLLAEFAQSPDEAEELVRLTVQT